MSKEANREHARCEHKGGRIVPAVQIKSNQAHMLAKHLANLPKKVQHTQGSPRRETSSNSCPPHHEFHARTHNPFEFCVRVHRLNPELHENSKSFLPENSSENYPTGDATPRKA
ncbi:hypothetical protein A2U01_0000550 [Trifolium medium]|uniref:Uncharacterized protein n=1 Tax=Trifolium medium TaxID=97028 RepID=A0A392LZQ5_9FABA|nr:hypothetical protein [Trifolium medium]